MVPSGRGIATLLAIAVVAHLPGGLLPATAERLAAAQAGGAAPAPAPAGEPPKAAQVPRPKPPTYELKGHVELLEKGKRSTDRSLQLRNTVVLFEPSRKEAPPKPVTAEMVTVKKEFSPRLLVVPVGSTVRFPNSDPILHNVFSISGKNSFDLGLVSKGPGKSATFPEPGIVRVFCNVHHAMFAYIYVVASPHWTTVADDGSFRIAGVPAGPGKLTVWNERSAPLISDLRMPAAAPLELDVEITMPRIPPHKNKLGKSYGGTNYG